MTTLRGATFGIAAVLAGTAFAFLGVDRLQSSGALQDPDTIVVHAELVAAMPRSLRESSGIAISDRYPVIWTHNDSGQGPILYAVDSVGSIAGRVRLRDVRARDFEDIDKGPCPPRWADEPYCLYVADTGNNDWGRRVLSIYVLPEPEPVGERVTVEAARLRFRYPDRRSDVEALAVASNGDLVLVTKGRRAGVRGYRISATEVARTLDSDDQAVVESLGTLPLTPNSRMRRLVTGGTYVDSLLVLRTYEGVFGFRRDNGTWSPAGSCIIRPREPQGEGIAHEGGERFLLTSEAGSSRYPSIHRVACPLGRAAESGARTSDSDPTLHRGVAWTAGPDSIDETDFGQLADLGVDWIAQTPFGWQSVVDAPELRMGQGARVWWGERDIGIATTTRAARERGIATLLKPHIWLSDRDNGVWRGQIAMSSEADWGVWFDNYSTFILHYAQLAEELGIEALCVGTELHGTVHRETEWRALIARVRDVYSGQLTYAANWHDEYKEVPFWDALDWIGVQAYFPVSDEEFPTADEIEDGWSRWMDDLRELQAREQRPVLLTEIGYRSAPFPGKEPWTWPKRGETNNDARALQAQADAYEGLFRAVTREPWIEGIYFWKWHPSSGRQRDRSAGFTPQDKPAEEVMSRWFAQLAPSR